MPAVTALTAVYLCCLSVGGICSMSLRQEITPDHLLGRVTSAFWSTHYSLGPAGAAVLTWAAGRYGVRRSRLVAGAGCLLVAVGGLFTPIRRAGAEPAAGQPGLRPAPAGGTCWLRRSRADVVNDSDGKTQCPARRCAR